LDLEILKKKLSTFRTDKGRLTKVSDDLLCEILGAWEQWTGPARGFYSALGADHRKMASLIGRAKRLKREGYFPEDSFKEIKIAEPLSMVSSSLDGKIELALDSSKLIRFSGVSQLIEFLIKYPSSHGELMEVKKAG
jgi:hypothetical protein